MDRQIVYPGQILPETTLLQMTKDGMIGLGKLAAAIFGNGPVVNGLAVTPTNPASMQVTVAPGEMYSLQNIDNQMFSTLPADQTHQIVKQGILLDPIQLTLAAPGNSGQSIAYLIEASYQDQDVNPAALPYYNSANPNQPFTGPGNNGQSQNTARKGAILVQAKAGVASASPTPPAPDSGFVGLYVVTVSYGQTQITAANIQQYSGAPLIPNVGLLQAIQSGSLSFGMDVGTANNYVVNLTPAQTLRQEGEVIRFKAKTTNTGASTLNDGIGAAPLVGGAHQPLQGGEIVAGGDAWVQWNSSVGANGSYILLECTGGALQVGSATASGHAVNLGQAQGLFLPKTGNIGIGTTPGNWSSAFASIQAGAVAAMASDPNSSYFGSNWISSQNGDVRIQQGYASRVVLNASLGTVTIQTAANSAPATPITWSNTFQIDGSGNVNINAQSQAWSPALSAIMLSQKFALAGDANSSYLGSNWYVGKSGDTYIANGAAAQVQVNAANGSVSFNAAPAGSAGAPITWQQVFSASVNGVSFPKGIQIPTAPAGDSSNSGSNTAFVQSTVSAAISAAIGALVNVYAPKNNANFTGINTVPTPPLSDNGNAIVNSAWVNSLIAAIGPLTLATFTNNQSLGAGQGYIKLPGGFTMMYGTKTCAPGVNTVNLATSFNGFHAIAIAIPQGSQANPTSTSFTQNYALGSFQITNSTGITTPFVYFCIGF